MENLANQIEKMKSLIVDTLDLNKGEEIVDIDLRDKSTIADHMILATATSGRHSAALAHKVMDEVSKNFPDMKKARVEGMAEADWVLVDFGDIIVHIFRPEVRNFYSLEKMWATTVVPREHKKMVSKKSAKAE